MGPNKRVVSQLGSAQPFTKEKLLIACLSGPQDSRDELRAHLIERYGAPDFESADIPFTFTHYYDAEMGTPIGRFFFSFDNLLSPDLLPAIKTETNAIEDRFRVKGHRKLNLDPGFLSLSRLILATTKDGSHRIPLRNGIFAEVTLVYEHSRFRPLDWTYPDYRSESYHEILVEIRELYKRQLKSTPAV